MRWIANPDLADHFGFAVRRGNLYKPKVMRSLRLSHVISLRELGCAVGISKQRVVQIELSETENTEQNRQLIMQAFQKAIEIRKWKVKTITAEQLQKFFDSLTSRQLLSNGEYSKPLSSGTLNVYAAVMRGAFRFAVFSKQLISFNPIQYITIRGTILESTSQYML